MKRKSTEQQFRSSIYADYRFSNSDNLDPVIFLCSIIVMTFKFHLVLLNF